MRFLGLAIAVLLARPLGAQVGDIVRPSGAAAVRGVAHDSLAAGPLAGALVQLVSTDREARDARTVVADSAGRFAFARVPDGRWLLGFFHPRLDSLGLEPTLREIHIADGRDVDADLAIPGARSIARAFCGDAAPAGAGLVIGVVREAAGRAPVSGATVVIEWIELALDRRRVGSSVARRTLTTRANGWFTACDVPLPGTVVLQAGSRSDSTDRVELPMPAHGVARRDLWLGPQTGRARMRGLVVAAAAGEPVADAIVRTSHGAETRTNARGEWSLEATPPGTRRVDVRALGYYPVRIAVDVLDGAPPVRTALSTMTAVLDTVRTTGEQLRDRHASEFAERRRVGGGRYIAAADVARRQPVVTSDLFRMVPGLQLAPGPNGGTVLQMRAIFAPTCEPTVWIDGRNMRSLDAEGIDTWVSPDEIGGIEIYVPGTVPMQFQDAFDRCGSIVIWTRPGRRAQVARTWREQLGRGALIVGLGALMGLALTSF